MSDGRLVIGSRRYSSWSLRGWLPVAAAGLDVHEVVIPLSGGHTEAVKAQSPSGLVPYLEHNGARIWESLAIIEYCAEFDQTLWPKKRRPRALARSAAFSSASANSRMLKKRCHGCFAMVLWTTWLME